MSVAGSQRKIAPAGSAPAWFVTASMKNENPIHEKCLMAAMITCARQKCRA
jgi:hypothetical protein